MSLTRRHTCAFFAGVATLVALVGFPIRAAAITAQEANVLARSAAREDGFPVVVNPQVLDELNRILESQEKRAKLRRGLNEMRAYQAGIEEALSQYGLPQAMLAVPLMESGYRNLPPKGSGAAGLWQFMPQTARNFGLIVDGTRDERLDVARETDAALRLLGALHYRFMDWGLALAGYNEGENHVQWAIDEGGTRDPWMLAQQGKLNSYYANIIAGWIVIRNPSLVEN